MCFALLKNQFLQPVHFKTANCTAVVCCVILYWVTLTTCDGKPLCLHTEIVKHSAYLKNNYKTHPVRLCNIFLLETPADSNVKEITQRNPSSTRQIYQFLHQQITHQTIMQCSYHNYLCYQLAQLNLNAFYAPWWMITVLFGRCRNWHGKMGKASANIIMAF